MTRRRPNGTSLAGTRVAITGAARGIGAATAEAFLAAGATVAIGDVDEVELKSIAGRLDVEADSSQPAAHSRGPSDHASYRKDSPEPVELGR